MLFSLPCRATAHLLVALSPLVPRLVMPSANLTTPESV